ncbi:hypothetical protein SUDANB95_05458 [Actinosynnema sp. ALI-1.44]
MAAVVKVPAGHRPPGRRGRPGGAPSRPAAGPGSSTWALVALVVSQTAAITAVLYLIGWARAAGTAAYFGIDTSIIGFTTTDYLLRSLNATTAPLVGVAVLGVIAAGMHRRVARAFTAGGARRRMVRTILVVVHYSSSVVLVAAVVGVVVHEHLWDWARAVVGGLLFLGAGVRAYTDFVLRRTRTPSLSFKAMSFLLVGLAAIGLLITMAQYAGRAGHRAAVDAASGLAGRPNLVVYSTEQLAITGADVVMHPATGANQKYRYRYSNLRLIMRTSRDQLLVVPAGWRKGRDSVLVLRESDGMRIEFIAPA